MEEHKRGGWHLSKETKLKISLKARGKKRHLTHGLTLSHPKLHALWSGMKTRCTNQNRAKYKDYGARGISVCQEWQNAENFIEWALNNGYQEGLQIDRIDNNGNYQPDNCRFVTPMENSRNRRNTKLLTLFGETKCVAEWCETVPISAFTVYWWIREKGREYAEQRTSEAIAAWNRRATQNIGKKECCVQGEEQ